MKVAYITSTYIPLARTQLYDQYNLQSRLGNEEEPQTCERTIYSAKMRPESTSKYNNSRYSYICTKVYSLQHCYNSENLETTEICLSR